MRIRIMAGKFRSALFCAVLLMVLAGGRLSAAETNELLPSKSYLTAYESMSAADRLQEREMNEDAAALYNEALKLFQQLASDYPMWQTNLVAFRVDYCRENLNKTLKLERRGGDAAALPLPRVTRGLSESENSDGRARASGPAASLNQTASPLRPSESLRSAEPAAPAGETNEVAGKIREASGLEQTGDFKGALELYKAVLAQDKQHLAALIGAGRCFLRLGMVDEARDILFQWCVIPSPDNGINSLLALILCHDRQYSKAIQLVEITLNEDNSNAAAHVILGVALAGMGQTDAAISEMQKALALNPRLSEAHYNLACLMLKKKPGKISTAAAYYLNALKFGATPDPALSKLLQK